MNAEGVQGLRQGRFAAVGAAALLILAVFSANAASQPSTNPQTPAATGPIEELKKTDLTYSDRRAWRALVKWPQDCESNFDYPDKSLGGLVFFELTAKTYLMQVTCTLGAYQGTYRYYRYDESVMPPSSRALTFITFEDSGSPGPERLQKKEVEEVVGLPEFDGRRKVLTVFDKFRGGGDCGILTTYSFPMRGTRLLEARAKLNCDGKGPFNPKQWKPLKLGSISGRPAETDLD